MALLSGVSVGWPLVYRDGLPDLVLVIPLPRLLLPDIDGDVGGRGGDCDVLHLCTVGRRRLSCPALLISPPRPLLPGGGGDTLG